MFITGAMLAACGGGGGGPTPVPVSQRTPTPTVPVPVHNANYAFNGSLTQSDSYTYPAASPLPPTSSSETISQTVVTGSSPLPSGAATTAASDLHSVESDAGALTTSTSTEDAWVGFTTQFGAPGIGVYGTFVSDGNVPKASTIQTVFTNAQQSDFTSEVNGAAWANSPAATIVEQDADGTTSQRVINADGSYSETEKSIFSSSSTPLTFISTSNSDGSGSYTGTVFSIVYGFNGIYMSAPANNQISVTALVPAPSPSPGATAGPTQTVVLGTPPAWFSGALYKETDTLSTGAAYPGRCSVGASYGTSGGHIAQVIDSIDPVIGIQDHKTVDTYTNAAFGPVCVLMVDTQTSYYDYLNDTTASIGNFADFAGTPQHVVTLAERLTLAPGAVISGARPDVGGASSLSAAAVATARARFEARVAHLRSEQIHAFQRFLKARLAPALATRNR